MSRRERPTTNVMSVPRNGHKVRVALYACVSGEEQTIGKNIGAQVDDLNGLVPASHEVVDIYLDDGVSGTQPFAERAEGSRLLADAAAGRFHKVMAVRLDRIGRDLPDIRQTAERLDELGIILHAQGTEFSQTATGKAMLNMFGLIAEFEKDLIKERLISGKRFKAKALGRWPGGTIPYGCSYDKGDPGQAGKFKVIEEEAEVVRRIYRMSARDDLGMATIAGRLNDEGVPTPSAVTADPNHPRAKKTNSRISTNWGRAPIGRILRNPAYMGHLLTAIDGERGDVPMNKMGDLIRTGAWQDMGLIEFRIPPIVDESLWWQAQEKLDGRRRLPNPQHEAWPLQSLVSCAKDGLTFGCRRNSGKTRVYSCAGREAQAHQDGSPRCKAPRLDAEHLEAAVLLDLKDVLSNPKTGRKAVEDYLSRLEVLQDEASMSLDPILDRLQKLEGKEARLDDLYVSGHISRESFEERLADILKTRQTLEVNKGKRQRDIDEFETRRREIEQIRAAIAEDRFHVTWSPFRKKLRIAVFREPDVVGEPFDFADGGEAEFRAMQPRRKKPSRAVVMKHGRGIERFEAAAIEARLETEYDLRRLFELFDINVVVHDDYVEVRGAFPKPMSIGLEEIDEVSSLRSRYTVCLTLASSSPCQEGSTPP